MSYIGKTVTFRLVDGTLLAGVVTDVVCSPYNQNELWYQLDTGWSVSERHVAAAHWGEGKSV